MEGDAAVSVDVLHKNGTRARASGGAVAELAMQMLPGYTLAVSWTWTSRRSVGEERS